MRFAHPDVVWLAAILLPLLGAFLVWAWRRKQWLVARFVQSRLLENLTVGVSEARQKLRLVLMFFAVACALLAWARPQWGFDWQEATTQGLDIIVAIDTSKSMLAEDISPNRLMRAKLAVFDLLKIAKSDRFGLIAFAGTAFLQCPLTLDEQVFRQSVESLDVNIIPQGGTALSEAISTAAQAFEKSENHKVLVLFTDGEDHDTDAIKAVEKAAEDGLKVFTIGIGTKEGEMLRIRDERGNPEFLKDTEGNAVKSRLNESLLEEISAKGNGFYLPLVGTTAMETLYQRGLASLPRSESSSKLVKNYRERFHWPLTISILLLLIETFLPHRKRDREGSAQRASGLKKASVTAVILLIPLLSFASTTSAKKKYETGKYAEAFADYQELLRKKTNDFRLHFNAGDAAYQAGELETARKHFETATIAPDLELQQKAYYNLGNAHYQIGEPLPEPKEKQEAWEQAIKNYQNALRLNEADQDAKNNLQFVQRKLEELKQQQQQEQKSDKDKDGKEKDDKQKQDSSKKDEKKDKQDQNKDQQQDQQKEDQAKKDQEEQKQKQEQEAKDQQQKKQDQQPQKDGKSSKPGDEQKPEGQEGEMAGGDGKMTQEQAQEFLEALKREEKPLIFMPPPKERKPGDPPLKDW